MLVFGGRYREGSSGPYTLYDDVWALDLASLTWQPLAVAGAGPEARGNATAVLDASANELVVFGGNTSTSGLSFEPQNDVWALDLATNTWREVTTRGAAPKARLFHTATIDPVTRTLFVYGGGGENAFQGPFYDDLWKLDLATGAWEELDDGGAGAPRGRIWSTIAFDAGASALVLFGGHDDGDVGNNNDTWTFDLGTRAWTAIVPPEKVNAPAADFCEFPADFTLPNASAPDRRSAQVAGFDPEARALVIFGGKTDCGIINDAWSFDAAARSWTRLVEATIGEACLRGEYPEQCTSMCL
jgi:hypothetical protein